MNYDGPRYSHSAAKDRIKALEAERDTLSARVRELEAGTEPLSEFCRFILAGSSWQGADVDGGVAQDMAERLGLIVSEPFDPVKHGENGDFAPGDPWFRFSDIVAEPRALLPNPSGDRK